MSTPELAGSLPQHPHERQGFAEILFWRDECVPGTVPDASPKVSPLNLMSACVKTIATDRSGN